MEANPIISPAKSQPPSEKLDLPARIAGEAPGSKIPLSVCLITYNEERNILPFLESVSWAEEVVIVDSFSTDQTLELARRHTDKILQQPLVSFAQQKNAVVAAASHEWVLCLDADERVSPSLAQEIRQELLNPACPWDGFYIRRHVHYLGRWINHGGWYPDYKLILYRKSRGSWGGMDLHTRVTVAGPTRRLQGDLWHFTYQDLAHQLRTVSRYSEIVAQQWQREGRRFRLGGMLFRPLVKFLEGYLYKQGFRDGMPGLIIAVVSSFYVFMKHARQWEMIRASRGSSEIAHEDCPDDR